MKDRLCFYGLLAGIVGNLYNGITLSDSASYVVAGIAALALVVLLDGREHSEWPTP